LKAQIGNIIKLALSIGLGVGLLYWFINQMTPEQRQETINSFGRANYFWLLMPLFFGFLSNFSRAQRWRLLLRPLGYNPSYIKTFLSVLTMYFFNLFVPRLGEVSRCGILAKYEGVPVEKSIGTMVVERVIDMITILLLLGFIMLVEYERLIGFFTANVVNKEETASNPLLKFGIPLVIAVAVAAGSAYIVRKHGWQTLKRTAAIRLKGLWDGVKSIRYLRDFWQFVFHSVFIWVCYILMIYLCFRALPETEHLGLLAGIATMVFGGFAMVATPGGIGAYPITVMGVLILYSIPDTIGGALGTMIWALQTVGALLGGVISLIVLALMKPSEAREVAPV
jgi:glycosyltransferase 2 family protein